MAFCTKCGNKLSDDAAFCPNCGQSVQAAPQTQPAEEWSAPVAQPSAATNGEDTPIMVKGILSLAFSGAGIPGIILGSMAKKGAAEWLASGKPLTGKIKAGNILGKLGFLFGIISTVSWALYILIAIITAIAASL